MPGRGGGASEDRGLDAGSALASIMQILGAVGHDRSELDADERLELAVSARRASGMLQSLLLTLVKEAEDAQAAMAAAGTPSASWFAAKLNMSRRESSGMLHQAQAVAGRAGVREAALTGGISPDQAKAIDKTLGQLPTSLSVEQQAHAEQVMLDMAAKAPAAELERAVDQVLAVVAPVDAAEQTGLRLQRQAERARLNRKLWFADDARGSILFGGQLPAVEGQLFIAQVGAFMESARRRAADNRLDAELTLEQRRADALVALLDANARAKAAPTTGGDRPRVVVTISQTDLKRELLHAGRLVDGQSISDGDLRRLACDAEILPVVLGGASEVLDVGRANRLVTPSIRAALNIRDQGCSFPRCDVPATSCEAHHIRPWMAGGPTALDNLVLLCRGHHGLVEPAKYAARDQWQVRIAPDGLPEFVPPARTEPDRRPVRHRRHTRHDTEDDPSALLSAA